MAWNVPRKNHTTLFSAHTSCPWVFLRTPLTRNPITGIRDKARIHIRFARRRRLESPESAPFALNRFHHRSIHFDGSPRLQELYLNDKPQ